MLEGVGKIVSFEGRDKNKNIIVRLGGIGE